jgi:hypothetical protein
VTEIVTGLRGQALARAVVQVVEQHPELHDQLSVTCGTTACLVGWTLALAGGATPGEQLFRPAANVERELSAVQTSRTSYEVAAQLLRVDAEELADDVFGEMDEERAISAFIELTGIADVPALPEVADAGVTA